MVSISANTGLYTPAGKTATSAPVAAPQDLRAAENKMKADAQKLVAQAEAEGGSATLNYTYTTGPDGKPYIASIQVTKTTKETIEPSVSREERLAQLSAAEEAQIAELRAADVAVRNHEALHYRSAGGVAVGTPEYGFVQGPDGKYYAVEGAVHTHTTATTDPEKAARDAATLARSALAPGDASAADLAAARSATSKAAQTYGQAMAGNRKTAIPAFNFEA